MKTLLLLALGLHLVSCATTGKSQEPIYLKSPGQLDLAIATAPIEDYILAVPPNELHEGARAGFEQTVRTARMLPRNQGSSADELYVPGDGSVGPYEFVLDRDSRTLNARFVGETEETPPHTIQYQRMPGAWLKRAL